MRWAILNTDNLFDFSFGARAEFRLAGHQGRARGRTLRRPVYAGFPTVAVHKNPRNSRFPPGSRLEYHRAIWWIQ